jgi:haloacetate dehalogenase
MTFDDFAVAEVGTAETTIFVRWAGRGPATLLLHGFPETHLMWRSVAPLLTGNTTVVCADLRGYGQSGCPSSTPDHAPYSKRAMATDMVAVMQHLGFPQFSVAGHDRGGRVACRMALDYPDRIERLAVLDIVPGESAWERADAHFALAFWPWCLLAQPEPLPESLLISAADAVVDNALREWGSPVAVFSPQNRAAYIEALRDPAHAHAVCEEYRAAAAIDREHEQADRAAGRRISCPVLVLWSATGPVGTWYARESGPIGLWREWSPDIRGWALNAGHFFPEEIPEQTAEALGGFFTSKR